MQDRVALVTGASGGIGRATAVALAKRGARVMAIARREPELAQLAREIGGHYVVCDLSSEEGCSVAIDETRRLLGPVEILVNNAGGSADDASVAEMPNETWWSTMGINLDAPFLLTRAAANDMIGQGWGRVVMVSSTAGEVGAPGMAALLRRKGRTARAHASSVPGPRAPWDHVQCRPPRMDQDRGVRQVGRQRGGEEGS